jgi:hypothetical protein
VELARPLRPFDASEATSVCIGGDFRTSLDKSSRWP